MELDAVNVWMMVAAALVLLMTPGVAFFYGGMTRITSACLLYTSDAADERG